MNKNYILPSLVLCSTLIVQAQTPVAPPPRPVQNTAPVQTAPQTVTPAATQSATPEPTTMPVIEGTRIPKNGIEYIDVQIGSGEEAKGELYLSYFYKWWLASNGKKAFAATIKPAYNIQLTKMLASMASGITGMRAGGKRRIFIPAAIAWGANGAKSATGEYLVPPNSDMVLDIELVSATQFPTGPKIQKAANVAGPSLEDTLKFISERLTANASVSFVIFGQNTTDGSTWNNTMSYTEGEFHIDTDACLISNLEKTGQSTVTSTYFFNTFEDVVVKPAEQFITENNARSGTPNQVITSTSPATVALILRAKNGNSFFYLTDSSMADRIAKASTHAIELCGGGNKDPF